MKKYAELLPTYLDGENINNHASIIDNQDTQILHKIQLLQLWNKLEKPILIERVQSEPGICTVNVYINTPQSISKISIIKDGSHEILEEHTEDELLTEKTFQLTATSEIAPVIPQIIVTVETHEGITYKKGYPENDENKENIYDHDAFLDIIGGLLGIPRRIYVEPETISEQILEKIYPKYFTKTMLDGHHSGDILTEDDYYYKERLKYFINNYNLIPLPVLMANLLYEWRDVELISMLERNTSLTSELKEYAGTAAINLIQNGERYANIDYTNMESILRKYVPLTRPALFTDILLVEFYINNIKIQNNTLILNGGSIYGYSLDYEQEYDLYKCPLLVTLLNQDTQEETTHIIYTNMENNSINAEINNITGTHYHVKVEYIEEYGNINTTTIERDITQNSAHLSVVTLDNNKGTAKLQATLTNQDGDAISDTAIYCKNGGSCIAISQTDQNGTCELNLSVLNAGSYTLNIIYPGNSTYPEVTVTHEINIISMNYYGKGQTTGWTSSMWTNIEINAENESHCNYLHHPAILKKLQLTGDFELKLHIQVSHNQSWNFGLVPQNNAITDPIMKVEKGDKLNGNTIANMFHTSGVIWDSTELVTITRVGADYTLEYNNNTYSFTGSAADVWFYMDKTGSGNIFMTYIETSATMQQ